jgi:WD40 repeat protein
LVTVIQNGTLHLWDVESGKELLSWKMPTWDQTVNKTKYPRPAIRQPVFSPDGKTLFASAGGKVHRWDVATGKELPAFEIGGVMKGDYTQCALSQDGRTLAVCSFSRASPMVLLNAATGRVRRRLEGVQAYSLTVAFSPDGGTLAVNAGGSVSLWEVASGRPRGRLEEPRGVFALSFSPDGRLLAVSSVHEEQVSLWDLAAGKVVGSIRSDIGRVESLAFSPDSSRLALAGSSPTALVCDVAALCGKKKIDEVVKITEPSAEELEGLWVALTGKDGARAYRAIRSMGLAGPRGAAFLKARLQGVKLPSERRIAQLIADLDSNNFTTREKATAELEKYGERAAPALRRTLDGEPSAEVRTRVKRLLDKLGSRKESPPSSELVRSRVIEALEANGTDEARKVLAWLAAEAKKHIENKD